MRNIEDREREKISCLFLCVSGLSHIHIPPPPHAVCLPDVLDKERHMYIIIVQFLTTPPPPPGGRGLQDPGPKGSQRQYAPV
jgi:hypothetical protein